MAKEIENIFSFKKEQPKKATKQIIVDTREKNALVPSYLFEKNASVEFKKLEVGDYQIANIIIERKTFHDLIQSIKTNRLKSQIQNLKQYEKRLIILEKNPNEEIHSKIHPHTINGTIIALSLHHNIPVIFTTSEVHTAQILVQIANQDIQEQSIQTKKIPKTKIAQQRLIIESFPGVGPKSAKKLLDTFKTIKKIANTKVEDRKEILSENVNHTFQEILE